MPRGRHRHSPPLHRILPSSAVVGVSVLCAGSTWLLAEPLVLRGLAAAAAAAAVTGAYLMRSWDREAGRRVAELTRARAGDEWRAEERIAELESDLEEARELRTRLETKLRRKRVELANLRGEHAALLRRYATAETERASALEGRRQLALEAAATPRELPAARSTPTLAAYLRAAQALEDLSRNGALQEARRTAEQARKRDLAERSREAEEQRGRHAAAEDRTGAQHLRPPAALPAPRQSAALPPARTAPASTAVAPYAASRRHPVPQGSFDFFGTQKAARAAIESVQNEDLADVVGEEALAVHRTGKAENRVVGEVIDLTAHDETEQLDVAELRSAIS
ncbi:hypothetical protein OIC43_24890 [Streptomyces sp. NBC_00825]|uniref:hypothetical protein n=1 Tax=unclassified Streptomyces TaxID=2593676 RepID=UPI002ED546EC|nr:hypothetical protein OG832_18790 [Streptomyces sp. NBC_00826]WTH92046.1 hypothetical protein OIC43_24890 [Streptomyces sp. NBC_00825]WTI00775.1 hypothetical protein OHA23_24875 [Streptomyces sp. NBC_00822]